jgi:hypothetical protein
MFNGGDVWARRLGGLAVVLFLTIVIILIAYFLIHPLPALGSPNWAFEGWYQDGQQVQTAVAGRPVELRIRVSAGGIPSIGILRVEIREDVVGSIMDWINPDVTIAGVDHSISLMPGQSQVLVTVFTPPSPTYGSSANWGQIREYFFKLWWNGQLLYDPKTPLARNGLQVSESQPEAVQAGQKFYVIVRGHRDYTPWGGLPNQPVNWGHASIRIDEVKASSTPPDYVDDGTSWLDMAKHIDLTVNVIGPERQVKTARMNVDVGARWSYVFEFAVSAPGTYTINVQGLDKDGFKSYGSATIQVR